MPEHRPGSDKHLVSRLDELESLLDGQDQDQDRPGSGSPAPPNMAGNIPILDELVTPGDFEEDDYSPVPDEGPDLFQLAERLEEKFSNELDEIVSILKGNLKKSIMTELKSQMDNQTEQNSDEK